MNKLYLCAGKVVVVAAVRNWNYLAGMGDGEWGAYTDTAGI